MILDRLCLNHAGVIHGTLQKAARRLSCQHHLPTIGADHATVADQRIHRALVHRDVEQAVSGQIERHGIAGGKRYATETGRDHAVVSDAGTQQGHITAVGIDRTLVQDCAALVARKPVIAGHEVAVAEVQRGGDESTDVDRCTLAEQNTVRIDQKHFSIG